MPLFKQTILDNLVKKVMLDIIYLTEILVAHSLLETLQCIDIVFWLDFFHTHSDLKDFIFKNM